jgi:RNA polymerase sigma-70 factor (ECF subfamily)
MIPPSLYPHPLGLSGYSTDDLMLLVQKGDSLACEALYLRIEPRIRRFLAARMSTTGMPDDVIQEVFCRLWAKPGSFTAGRASAVTFLFRMALNVANEYRRQNERLAVAMGATLPHLSSECGPVPDALELSELLAAVKTARVKLSGGQSAAVALVYDEGLDVSEAAQRLRCTEKAVRRRLDAAMRKLQVWVCPAIGIVPHRGSASSAPQRVRP